MYFISAPYSEYVSKKGVKQGKIVETTVLHYKGLENFTLSC